MFYGEGIGGLHFLLLQTFKKSYNIADIYYNYIKVAVCLLIR